MIRMSDYFCDILIMSIITVKHFISQTKHVSLVIKIIVGLYYLYFLVKFYLNASNFILVLKISDHAWMGKSRFTVVHGQK